MLAGLSGWEKTAGVGINKGGSGCHRNFIGLLLSVLASVPRDPGRCATLPEYAEVVASFDVREIAFPDVCLALQAFSFYKDHHEMLADPQIDVVSSLL